MPRLTDGRPRRGKGRNALSLLPFSACFSPVRDWASPQTYLSQNASCGGGLGRIGIGMGILNMLACTWPMTGGIALYSLAVAL